LVEQEQAEELFKRNTRAVQQALATLPKHRDLLRKVHQYGFHAL